jgi:maltooligosyltrehalose trehalohydrolase
VRSLSPTLGVTYLGGGRCRFSVWAPRAERVEVRVVSPEEKWLALERSDLGYHEGTLEGVEPGARYLYRLDGASEYPDPASRFQPEGVHGPSEVISGDFSWSDGGWPGLALADFVFYELHVGTFTAEGTFEAVIPHLDELKELGVTAIELMPVAQFPGSRNWGYDGVQPYAVQRSYGGPRGLKRLVDAAHGKGLAMVLDVVYNHLGPEGNYLSNFAPYFTDRYRTPWGQALNFDGAESDPVRRYFIENAIYWLNELHFDALRLDAVHAIADASPFPFLEELAVHVRERCPRRVYLIPESAANDARLIRSRDRGGYGLDAQWNDDFHHALRVALTGERRGYYEDYRDLGQLEKAFREGYVYSGEYSTYRRRRHGISSQDVPAERFVVFSQNHDQVGNRMLGERLTELVDFERQKLAAGAVILSPFLPLLFMGEEYGETHRFPYFVSHGDAALIEAVRRGRREEFAAFGWSGEPPDPQSEATFASARLQHRLKLQEPHRTLYAFYRELLRLRREITALGRPSKECMKVRSLPPSSVISMRRWTRENPDGQALVLYNFGDAQARTLLPLPAGDWETRLDSSQERWRGPGSALTERFRSQGEIELSLPPWSFTLLTRET